MEDSALEAAGPPAARSSPGTVWALIGVEALCFLGSEIARFGVSVWLYEATHSVYAFAALILANTVPGMLIAPLAGSIVDRHSRKAVMIGAATVALCGTLIVLAGASFGHLSLVPIVFGAMLASVGEAFQWPALSATIPLMTTEEELPRYNGFLESARATSMLAGPIIGGLMIGILRLPGLLVVEVTTFITATIVVSRLAIPRQAASENPEEQGSLLSDSMFGLRYIFARKHLLKFLGVATFANFFLSIGIVLMTPYALSFLSERAYGIANGLFGAGMIAGGIAYGVLEKRFKNITLFLGTALIMGALYGSYGFTRGVILLSALNFVLAVLMTIGNSAIMTIWQLKVPEEVAGRVLSAMNMIASAAGPLAYLVVGPLSENLVPAFFASDTAAAQAAIRSFGANQSGQMGFIFTAMGVLLFLGFAIAWTVRDVREVEERDA